MIYIVSAWIIAILVVLVVIYSVIKKLKDDSKVRKERNENYQIIKKFSAKFYIFEETFLNALKNKVWRIHKLGTEMIFEKDGQIFRVDDPHEIINLVTLGMRPCHISLSFASCFKDLPFYTGTTKLLIGRNSCNTDLWRIHSYKTDGPRHKMTLIDREKRCVCFSETAYDQMWKEVLSYIGKYDSVLEQIAHEVLVHLKEIRNQEALNLEKELQRVLVCKDSDFSPYGILFRPEQPLNTSV